MDSSHSNVLAIDFGEKRIGLARGFSGLKFASPLTTIETGADVFNRLASIIDQEQIGLIVVGRPINSAGNETDQTRHTVNFVEDLKQHTKIPIIWQEETLTSVKAEQELADRGKPYKKGEVDALAATYILEDYLETSATSASRTSNV